MGSGLRLLPLIGGLSPARSRPTASRGASAPSSTVALGFVLIAAGLALGSSTSVGLERRRSSPPGWRSSAPAWGWRWRPPPPPRCPSSREEHSGVGSAVLQAVNKTGGPLGTAMLGSILSSAYLARPDLAGLPAAPPRAAARESIFGGVAVADRLHSPALLHSARAAFVHGIDQSLLVSAGIAVAGALLALLSCRQRAARARANERAAHGSEVVASA